MGLGIKKMLIEAEELANKIHAINLKGIGIPKWEAARRNSMQLKLTHINAKLNSVGKKHEFSVIEFINKDGKKYRVLYPTHDEFELTSLFLRDFGPQDIMSVRNVFTAEKY